MNDLQVIVEDMKVLETEGIFIENLGMLYGTISSLSHDNLAANDFVEIMYRDACIVNLNKTIGVGCSVVLYECASHCTFI